MVRKSTMLMKFMGGQISRSYSAARIPLTNREIIAKRNALFTEEKNRQAGMVRRVEKIRVHYRGNPADCDMVMNKDISTPADCLKHLPKRIRELSVLAYVDGQAWDMHAPLKDHCMLSFAHFKDLSPEKVNMVNKVFWRTCSYLLGFAIERSFKDEHRVLLHSWPAPSIQSGSFVYDAVLPLKNWIPSQRELLAIGHPVHKMYLEPEIFERLEVDREFGKLIFEDNPLKQQQVDDFAETDAKNKVVLYRCKDHVDMSRGPMIADTGFIRGFDITSVHPFDSPIGLVYRFQAIAYPSAFTMSPFAMNVLKSRARTMNTIGLPEESTISAKQGSPEQTPAEPRIPGENEEDSEHTTTANKVAQ